MSPAVHSSAVYDALIQTFDVIELEPDAAKRLALLLQLKNEFTSRVLESRNKAAYEARQTYSIRDVAVIADCDTTEVYYWSDRWRKERDLPRLKRRERVDVSTALPATGFTRTSLRRRRDTPEAG